MNNIIKTRELGQQIWLDNLSRSLIHSKKLVHMRQLGVTGITTNPAIFSKAIESDSLYQKDIDKLNKKPLTAKQKYEFLAIQDVQDACDEFFDTYQESHFQYGYVSIELDPYLSQNYENSVREAKRLWQLIDRPNVMIKVPATGSGIKVFEYLISEGMNVNITLLFSLEVTRKIHYAYLNGLKTRLANAQPINHIRAVASFFLSRIDTALDVALPQHLQGKVAISIAKQAYQDWLTIFDQQQLVWLNKHDAKPIWLLWASTGTKNPDYCDVLYVDNLIGVGTVNTLPEQTLNFFVEHGTASPSLINNIDQARMVLAEVEELGISLENLSTKLQQEGLLQFEQAFQKILDQLN
ncbi:MAG: transaldolase [Neisseriaceae bacterium]|nr:MAG: transaldolase [Neisseriaceae bacterium]